MKTIFIYILFFAFATRSAHASQDLVTMRQLLKESVNNSKVAHDFYDSTRAIGIDSKPILLGFKAMSELVLCKHVFSPVSKLTHFSKGKALLEKAIILDPESAELRFYRYCTQLNAPGFLNYSSRLNEDKLFLFSFLASQTKNAKKDVDLYVRIKSFLLTNKHATEQDKQKLKSI